MNGENQDTMHNNLLRQEKQYRARRRLRSILGKRNSKGLDKVGVMINDTYVELT